MNMSTDPDEAVLRAEENRQMRLGIYPPSMPEGLPTNSNTTTAERWGCQVWDELEDRWCLVSTWYTYEKAYTDAVLRQQRQGYKVRLIKWVTTTTIMEI